jgi:hypothetical protein
MKKEVLQEMLVDDEEIFEGVVKLAKEIFKLDKEGRIIFQVPCADLTQKEEIAMVLLGKYFASELEISESDIMTADDIAGSVEAEVPSVRARLNDLKGEQIVESPSRGQFRISILHVEKILKEIIANE